MGILLKEKQQLQSTDILLSQLKGAIFVLTFILSIFAYFKLSRQADLGIPEESRQLSGSFKLTRIYRHGIGMYHDKHQILEIDDTNMESLRANYQSELYIMNTNEHDEGMDQLWTSNPMYTTDNPFNYEFKLGAKNKNLLRLVNRDPEFIEAYLDSYGSSNVFENKVLEWKEGGEDVLVPDVTDMNTVISLALMSSNAYVKLPQTGDWRNVTEPWKESRSDGYGWDSDGLRGHIFYNEVNDIVVLSVKGTSAQGIPGAGDDETTTNDKLNDNLLFSCCCARVSYLWTTVCDCYTKSYTCDESCLEQSMKRKDGYYQAVMEIYKDILEAYPTASVWLTGHSLGGALSALLARTYGLPAITFEAPGEALAAKRLHLPYPPGLPEYEEHIWHIGHTADPIFMGTCNGASSSCSIAGYAMETQCHSGYECVYDVVKDKGWHVNILNHRIHTLIDKILNEYDEVAQCVRPEECIDCYNWNFIPNQDETSSAITTTSNKKTKTNTRSKTATKTTSTTNTKTTTAVRCIGRNWVGICTDYGPAPT
ncbi:hypothetical protein TPHA_0M01800 [Tetrapisispora phaffii CBS 4417]|uniref:Putative lipase ATG15 n=1 Tax=Tetrapisispora phaffii (strain ATCC 24235 / CBS 4417 / NBRC 1672 / NRRL Y-8282 / UCD 70-5) TaxID=1071381 RepID=G8C0P0_TETPH|nr:hypothetical protein TPHA_0M01800 [Tetrapisispora phaffii CBS 4417]CCE65755.1 hypothetical protein TPHA_0M01800 [Tetrapisispora phaffii CBS 4417]